MADRLDTSERHTDASERFDRSFHKPKEEQIRIVKTDKSHRP